MQVNTDGLICPFFLDCFCCYFVNCWPLRVVILLSRFFFCLYQRCTHANTMKLEFHGLVSAQGTLLTEHETCHIYLLPRLPIMYMGRVPDLGGLREVSVFLSLVHRLQLWEFVCYHDDTQGQQLWAILLLSDMLLNPYGIVAVNVLLTSVTSVVCFCSRHLSHYYKHS